MPIPQIGGAAVGRRRDGRGEQVLDLLECLLRSAGDVGLGVLLLEQGAGEVSHGNLEAR